MESLNLHTLASSLPAAQHNTEELTNNFRAAALSITTLYKSSRKNSKRAYSAGYAAACQDLLTMIQQGVSVSSNQDLTIGRVMDWTEARLEAIKAREEEEDEEEEREKEKETGKQTKTTAPAAVPVTKPAKPALARAKTQPLPTPASPRSSHPPISEPSSPSPPPPAALRPIQRPIRPRGLTKPKPDLVPGSMDFDFLNDPGSSGTPIPLAAGAKRRHAVMMMLDAAPSSASVSIDGSPLLPHAHAHSSPTGCSAGAAAVGGGGAAGSSRRRTRRQQNQHQHQNQNVGPNVTSTALQDAMDVEEEGRERKRVARR
ncbi:hypothetical protein E4T56_gene8750 [Termitomyces sp. T112]|nr:hypothetical protein E4T56_gene8750 [Termitomyces sp. T112]